MNKHKPHENDIPAEIDFSGATRGKFYKPNMKVNLPIYLDTQVQDTLVNLANAKGLDLSIFINNLLKKDIELIQMSVAAQTG